MEENNTVIQVIVLNVGILRPQNTHQFALTYTLSFNNKSGTKIQVSEKLGLALHTALCTYTLPQAVSGPFL